MRFVRVQEMQLYSSTDTDTNENSFKLKPCQKILVKVVKVFVCLFVCLFVLNFQK